MTTLLLLIAVMRPQAAQVDAALIAITVPRLDSTVAWYRDILGMKVLNTDAEHANLAGAGLRVELIALRPAPTGQLAGYGVVKVGAVLERSAYLALLDRLRKHQARFVGRELQEADGSRGFIVSDNNGVWLQFLSVR